MEAGEVSSRSNLPRKAAAAAVVLFAVAGIVTLLAVGLINRTAVTGLSGFRLVQKPAPGFDLTLLEGGDFSLSDMKGQPTVINFWSSWCAPCVDEAPVLESAWRKYQGQGVQFVGVQIQDTEDAGREFIHQFDITYPTGLDFNGAITIDYGVIGIPVTYFVNREGIVQRRFVGAISEQRLTAWVDELVAGVAPSGEVEGENPEGFFDLN
ncbi:MAG: TlpA family protein disulfide reductase [Chloroflexi bacterium]|nr:TlpA family protein disulfide reductase [Chloroflexota bacterium]